MPPPLSSCLCDLSLYRPFPFPLLCSRNNCYQTAAMASGEAPLFLKVTHRCQFGISERVSNRRTRWHNYRIGVSPPFDEVVIMRKSATRVRRLFVLMLVLAGLVNTLFVQRFTNGAGLSEPDSPRR